MFYENNRCIAINYEGRLASTLLTTLTLTDMKQVNYVKNNYNRILDLTLTNMNNITTTKVNGIVEEDPYHHAFVFHINPKEIKLMKCKKSQKNNYFKADYDSIKKGITQVNWPKEFTNLITNEATDKFYEIFNKLIVKFTPKIEPRSNDFPKWYSKELIQLVKEKEVYFKAMKRKNNNSTNEIYKTLFKEKRKTIKHKKKKDLKEYQKNIERLVKINPKSFFAYTKSLQKTNKLPALMRYGDNISETIVETANLFAEYFSSVYSQYSEPFDCQCNNECTEYLRINEEDISEVIHTLDKNKTNSPDNIPAVFYLYTIDTITKPLKLLFSIFIHEMKYPDAFKISLVSPIHKSGDEDNIMNYRPISILSTIAKIFDKLIQTHLCQKTKHLISGNQHGFTSGKSITTNLLEYVDISKPHR